jgi:hypothetical protein
MADRAPRVAWVGGLENALIVEIATACEAQLARLGHGPEVAAEEADDEGIRLFQAAPVAGYSVVRGAPTRVAR